MARLARAVVPGLPHLLTQRGNRGEPVFFGTGDYALYRDLLAASCRRCDVAVWAWCLMANHVHLVAVPLTADGLALALGEAHRRYTRAVNDRQGWTGHLWQGRFASCALDDEHLLAAVRYVELNPVRARLVPRPQAWRWSSARAHLRGRNDRLTAASPLTEKVGDWRAFQRGGLDEELAETLRRHARTGRPLGGPAFLDRLEAELGRTLRPGKRGPKPRGGQVR
jgi:putative transposase